MNGTSGLCCPSYRRLAYVCGLSLQAVSDALARLELARIIRVTRRIERRQVERSSPITGLPEVITTTVQGSNLYIIAAEEESWLQQLSLPPANARSFPPRRQFALVLDFVAGKLTQPHGEKPAPLIYS